MKAEKFLNKYREYQSKYGFLKFVVLSMIVIQVIQLFGILYAINQQTVVIVPTSEFSKKFVVKNGVANLSYVDTMSRYFMELLLNYTPKTIEENYNLLANFISPDLYPSLRKQLDVRVANVQQTQASQVFYITQVAIDPNSKKVRVIGNLERIINNQVVFNNAVTYELDYTIEDGRFFVTSLKELNV